MARVRAMQSPAPPRRTLPSVLLVTMAIVMIGSAVVVENTVETMFENALRQDSTATAHGSQR